MTSSTFSVVETEARETVAHGFQSDAQDFTKGKNGLNGTLKATVPYFNVPAKKGFGQELVIS